MASVLAEIVINAEDAPALAEWWGKVLGWKVTHTEHGYSWMSVDGGHTPPMLVVQPVPEKKVGHNRLHLDITAFRCEQAEELERLLSLGATRADVGQPADAGFIVLADPEGNEFCLLGHRVD